MGQRVERVGVESGGGLGRADPSHRGLSNPRRVAQEKNRGERGRTLNDGGGKVLDPHVKAARRSRGQRRQGVRPWRFLLEGEGARERMHLEGREVHRSQLVTEIVEAVVEQRPTERRLPAAGFGDEHGRDVPATQDSSVNEVEIAPELLDLDREILVEQGEKATIVRRGEPLPSLPRDEEGRRHTLPADGVVEVRLSTATAHGAIGGRHQRLSGRIATAYAYGSVQNSQSENVHAARRRRLQSRVRSRRPSSANRRTDVMTASRAVSGSMANAPATSSAIAWTVWRPSQRCQMKVAVGLSW